MRNIPVCWKSILSWSVVLLYAAAIFFISSQPSVLIEEVFIISGIDKVFHVLVYATFSLLVYWAIGCSFPNVLLRTRCSFSIIVSVLYGISDEVHQVFVPMRHGDPFDVLADAVGAISAIIVLRAIVTSSHVSAAGVEK